MPAHRLTASVDQVTARVEAVLAGAPLDTSAAGLGMTPADLSDAVDTYRSAGVAALQGGQDRCWFQARLTPQDWAGAEAMFAAQIAPRLDQLHDASWWFLRKHPCWRLRVRTTDHQAVEALLDDLTATGAIRAWHASIYEPETAAFGGPTAMTIIHDLFCADSKGVLSYARQHPPQLGRRELSLLLVTALCQHSGLDWFETGDVFDRVAQIRPTPADADTARLDTLTAQLRPLLAIPIDATHPIFTSGDPAAHATAWLGGFIHGGQLLHDAASNGRLDRGLRAVLTHIVIFHWNRLGLPAATQGILAHAAKAAMLSRS